MAAKCPICSKPALERFRPFCSKRCADIDLNQWFKGGYAIPGSAPESDSPDDAGGAGTDAGGAGQDPDGT